MTGLFRNRRSATWWIATGALAVLTVFGPSTAVFAAMTFARLPRRSPADRTLEIASDPDDILRMADAVPAARILTRRA